MKSKLTLSLLAFTYLGTLASAQTLNIQKDQTQNLNNALIDTIIINEAGKYQIGSKGGENGGAVLGSGSFIDSRVNGKKEITLAEGVELKIDATQTGESGSDVLLGKNSTLDISDMKYNQVAGTRYKTINYVIATKEGTQKIIDTTKSVRYIGDISLVNGADTSIQGNTLNTGTLTLGDSKLSADVNSGTIQEVNVRANPHTWYSGTSTNQNGGVIDAKNVDFKNVNLFDSKDLSITGKSFDGNVYLTKDSDLTLNMSGSSKIGNLVVDSATKSTNIIKGANNEYNFATLNVAQNDITLEGKTLNVENLNISSGALNTAKITGEQNYQNIKIGEKNTVFLGGNNAKFNSGKISLEAESTLKLSGNKFGNSASDGYDIEILDTDKYSALDEVEGAKRYATTTKLDLNGISGTKYINAIKIDAAGKYEIGSSLGNGIEANNGIQYNTANNADVIELGTGTQLKLYGDKIGTATNVPVGYKVVLGGDYWASKNHTDRYSKLDLSAITGDKKIASVTTTAGGKSEIIGKDIVYGDVRYNNTTNITLNHSSDLVLEGKSIDANVLLGTNSTLDLSKVDSVNVGEIAMLQQGGGYSIDGGKNATFGSESKNAKIYLTSGSGLTLKGKSLNGVLNANAGTTLVLDGFGGDVAFQYAPEYNAIGKTSLSTSRVVATNGTKQITLKDNSYIKSNIVNFEVEKLVNKGTTIQGGGNLAVVGDFYNQGALNTSIYEGYSASLSGADSNTTRTYNTIASNADADFLNGSTLISGKAVFDMTNNKQGINANFVFNQTPSTTRSYLVLLALNGLEYDTGATNTIKQGDSDYATQQANMLKRVNVTSTQDLGRYLAVRKSIGDKSINFEIVKKLGDTVYVKPESTETIISEITDASNVTLDLNEQILTPDIEKSLISNYAKEVVKDINTRGVGHEYTRFLTPFLENLASDEARLDQSNGELEGEILSLVGSSETTQVANTLENLNNTLDAIASSTAVKNIAQDMRTQTSMASGARLAKLSNPYNTDFSYALNALSKEKIAGNIDNIFALLGNKNAPSNNIWANIIGGSGKSSKDASKSNIYGINAGYDKTFGKNIFGVTISYARGSFQSQNQKNVSDNVAIGAYGRIGIGENYELDLGANAIYGMVDESTQSSLINNLNNDSKYKTYSTELSANVGRIVKVSEDFVVKPFVGVVRYDSRIGEKLGSRFNATSRSESALYGRVGAEFRRYFSSGGFVYATPSLEQGLSNSSEDGVIKFVNGGSNMIFSATGKNATFAQVLLGGEMAINANTRINVGFGTKQNLSENSSSFVGSLGAKYKF